MDVGMLVQTLVEYIETQDIIEHDSPATQRLTTGFLSDGSNWSNRVRVYLY